MAFYASRCILCNEYIPGWESHEFSCECVWCTNCLQMAFSAAARSEAHWPVECCERIELDSVRHHLAPTTLSLLEQRIPMYETPAYLRAYCHNRYCSAFIFPEYVQDGIAECTQCNQWTCTNCKNAAHEGTCVFDAATQQIFALAAAKLWRQCTQCHQMIEHDEGPGCDTMTCSCGHIFCYRCGLAWHECQGICAPRQESVPALGFSPVQETVTNNDEQSASDFEMGSASEMSSDSEVGSDFEMDLVAALGWYNNEAEPEF